MEYSSKRLPSRLQNLALRHKALILAHLEIHRTEVELEARTESATSQDFLQKPSIVRGHISRHENPRLDLKFLSQLQI